MRTGGCVQTFGDIEIPPPGPVPAHSAVDPIGECPVSMPPATVSPAALLSCGVYRGASHRGLVVRVEVLLPGRPELEQAALAAEPVGRALVVVRTATSSCSTSIPQTGSIAMAIDDASLSTPGEYSRARRRIGTPPAYDPTDDRSPTRRPPAPPHRRARPAPGRGGDRDRRARRDDLRVAGGRGQPGLRAAARSRPARPRTSSIWTRSRRRSTRLDEGTFGACVRCGKPIAAERDSRHSRGRPIASTASGSSGGQGSPVTSVQPRPDARRHRRGPGGGRTLNGVAVHTPLVPSSAPPDGRFLKAESLQPIGAFKIRGAYIAIASLTDGERARGVITYSSGNHAQGVARAARLLGDPGGRRHARRRARRSSATRVAADGAEIVVVGHGQRRAPGRRGTDRRRARTRDHPAVRRRPGDRRSGHGRPRDRRSAAGRRS